MKPAAPVTSSLIRAPRDRRRGPSCHGGRQASWPRSLPSTEYGGRGARAAGTRPWCTAPRGCPSPAAVEDLARRTRTRSTSRRRRCGGRRSPRSGELGQRLGQVAGERRRPDLVVDHAHLRPQAEHGLDEVPARRRRTATTERTMKWRGFGRGVALLARELGAPVGRERVDRVRLQVRLALGPVEHVVARHVQDRAARPRRRCARRRG